MVSHITLVAINIGFAVFDGIFYPFQLIPFTKALNIGEDITQ